MQCNFEILKFVISICDINQFLPDFWTIFMIEMLLRADNESETPNSRFYNLRNSLYLHEFVNCSRCSRMTMVVAVDDGGSVAWRPRSLPEWPLATCHLHALLRAARRASTSSHP